MAETPTTEFWRDIKPIQKVFKADALPEAYVPNAAIDDDRYYVRLSETVFSRQLWISPAQNRWCTY
jgi:2,4'-dihydroxyacetophenone dioxygenase